MFSAFEPIHHHHKEVEDPHFHELREEWESVRDNIGRFLAKMKEGKGEEAGKSVVKEVEKAEAMEKESRVEEDVVKEVEKVVIKEGEEITEVKEKIKHVEAMGVMEVKEDTHNESHEDDMSPLDPGDVGERAE